MASSGIWGTGPCVPEGSGGGNGAGFFTAALCARCVVCVSARPATGRHNTPATSNPVSFNPALMKTPPLRYLLILGRRWVSRSNSSTAFGLAWPAYPAKPRLYPIERIDFTLLQAEVRCRIQGRKCNFLHLLELAWSVQFLLREAGKVFDAGCLLKRHVLKRKTPITLGCGRLLFSYAALALLVFSASSVLAEGCVTSSDMDDATRTALTAAALRYFGQVAKGDTASLRQSAAPSVAGDFSGMEAIVKDNQPALDGSKAAARSPFLLVAEGTAPIARAEFFCGVFGANGQTHDS